MRRNIGRICEAGVDGIVTTGSYGEFHSMSWEDHKRLIEVLVDAVPGRVKAIPGCSGVNTAEAIMKTRFARDCGADAVMNVSPFYMKLSEMELIGYWKDLAEACPDIGLIVYNNPDTSQLHTIEIFKELAKIDSLCGSKEITTIELHMDIMRHTDLTPMTAREVDYYVPTMMLGSKGIFSMGACMFPRYIVSVQKACKEGRWQKALKMQDKLRDVWDWLLGLDFAEEYGAIARFKSFMTAFEIIDGGNTCKPFIQVPKEIHDKYNEAVMETFPDLIES